MMRFILKYKDGESVVLKNHSDRMVKDFITKSLNEGKFQTTAITDGETIVQSTKNLKSITIEVN